MNVLMGTVRCRRTESICGMHCIPRSEDFGMEDTTIRVPKPLSERIAKRAKYGESKADVIAKAMAELERAHA